MRRFTMVSCVNYICRITLISFAGQPPFAGRVSGPHRSGSWECQLQDDGVMDHPINRRRGGHGVGEDAFPLREDQV